MSSATQPTARQTFLTFGVRDPGGQYLVGMRAAYRQTDGREVPRVVASVHQADDGSWVAWMAPAGHINGVHERASSVEALERLLHARNA